LLNTRINDNGICGATAGRGSNFFYQVCVCVCVLSQWVHGAVAAVPHLPSLKSTFTGPLLQCRICPHSNVHPTGPSDCIQRLSNFFNQVGNHYYTCSPARCVLRSLLFLTRFATRSTSMNCSNMLHNANCPSSAVAHCRRAMHNSHFEHRLSERPRCLCSLCNTGT
jgi:hypothetical protein